MKIIQCEQGSTEWKIVRMGKPTASQFHRIVSPKTGKVLEGRRKYMLELLAEWAGGYFEGEDTSEFMDRGARLEDDAIAAYELEHDVDVERVGFVTNNAGTIGASPDGLLDPDAGLETKVPALKTHIGYALSGDDTGDYISQVQGGLFVCERERWVWYSHNPSQPPVEVTFARDEHFIRLLSAGLDQFLTEMAEARADLLKKGWHPVSIDGAESGTAKISTEGAGVP